MRNISIQSYKRTFLKKMSFTLDTKFQFAIKDFNYNRIRGFMLFQCWFFLKEILISFVKSVSNNNSILGFRPLCSIAFVKVAISSLISFWYRYSTHGYPYHLGQAQHSIYLFLHRKLPFYRL